jgi:hypothetical protein
MRVRHGTGEGSMKFRSVVVHGCRSPGSVALSCLSAGLVQSGHLVQPAADERHGTIDIADVAVGLDVVGSGDVMTVTDRAPVRVAKLSPAA